MRAVLMRAVGGPEVLKLADVPEPEISGEHHVRVRLRAWTGMDRTDVRNLRVSLSWMPAPSVFGWFGHRGRQRQIPEQTRTERSGPAR